MEEIITDDSDIFGDDYAEIFEESSFLEVNQFSCYSSEELDARSHSDQVPKPNKTKNSTHKTENHQNAIYSHGLNENLEKKKLNESFKTNNKNWKKIKTISRNLNYTSKKKRADKKKFLSEFGDYAEFEAFVPMDSRPDFQNYNVTPYGRELDYNFIVRVKNNNAYDDSFKSELNEFYWENDNKSSDRYYTRSEYFSGNYTEQSHGGDQFDYWGREVEDRRYRDRYLGCERRTREKEDFYFSDHRVSPEFGSSRMCSDLRRKTKKSRWDDHGEKSGGSSWNESCRYQEGNKISHKKKSKNSRSNYDYRSQESRSPSHKVKKKEVGSSRSVTNSKPNSERESSPKRQKTSKSSALSIWERLDNFVAPETSKKKNNSPVNSISDQPVERGEQSSLVSESSVNPLEIERLGSTSMEVILNKDQEQNPGNVALPEQTMNQYSNCGTMYSTASCSYNVQMYQMQYYQTPMFSQENLPLMPGPSGLPIHVTDAGEVIPHDIDGRRIPIGPNGYYLPLDPNGRIFAHIVSPGNQAVPIHMTDDGVLRLPNSDPVPFGPSHNLPVNIDGSIIYIGPDSKPLTPCPNLPRQPPYELMQRESQQRRVLLEPPRTETTDNSEVPVEPFKSPIISPNVSSIIESPSERIDKAELVNEYKKGALEKTQCKEIEKNLGVFPSKGGIKRSTPLKFAPKKVTKDKSGSDTDMNTDCDPTTKIQFKETEGSSSENASFSQNNSGTVLDDKASKTVSVGSKPSGVFIEKIQKVLESLCEENFKPPTYGRFILSTVMAEDVIKISRDVSPLLRNRIQLPFITPNAKYCSLEHEHETAHTKTGIAFKFLTAELFSEKADKTDGCSKAVSENSTFPKVPVFTFDFAMQCDFTTSVINDLSSKNAKLEMEIVRLRNVNANLLDSFRNIQKVAERKSEELKKALLEIENKNNDISALKRFIELHKMIKS